MQIQEAASYGTGFCELPWAFLNSWPRKEPEYVLSVNQDLSNKVPHCTYAIPFQVIPRERVALGTPKCFKIKCSSERR